MKTYKHAKSWCYCGHLGDGMDGGDPMRRSVHGGINGHGPCLVEGCDCRQFTWRRFTNEFLAVVQEDARSQFRPAS